MPIINRTNEIKHPTSKDIKSDPKSIKGSQQSGNTATVRTTPKGGKK